MNRFKAIQVYWGLAAIGATGLAGVAVATERGRQIVSHLVQNPGEYIQRVNNYLAYAAHDIAQTSKAVADNPVGFLGYLGKGLIDKVGAEMHELGEALLDNPGKPVIITGTAFVLLMGWKLAARYFANVPQSFNAELRNTSTMQSDLQQLASSHSYIKRKQVVISTGELIDFFHVGGTPWNYVLRSHKGKQFLLKFDTLAALELAITGKKPANFNAENFSHAQAVSIPENGDIITRMRLDAKSSSDYGLVSGNLVKTKLPTGVRYQSPEFKIDLIELNGKVIAEVNYQSLDEADGVALCGDTTFYMKRDVTDMVKDSNQDAVVSGFVTLMHLDAGMRDQLLEQYFGRSNVDNKKSNDEAKTLSWDDIGKLLNAFRSPFSAGGYIADRTIKHLKPPIPSALRDLVKSQALKTGDHLMWEVPNGLLKDSSPVLEADLPKALQIPFESYSQVFEFITSRAYGPRNNIYDDTRWNTDGVATLGSPFGITGLKCKSDPSGAIYFVYSPRHAFSQTKAAQTPLGQQVAGVMNGYVARGGRIDDLKAVNSLMEQGNRILRLDASGMISTASIYGNFSFENMKFVRDVTSVQWTQVTPEVANQALVAVAQPKQVKPVVADVTAAVAVPA